MIYINPHSFFQPNRLYHAPLFSTSQNILIKSEGTFDAVQPGLYCNTIKKFRYNCPRATEERENTRHGVKKLKCPKHLTFPIQTHLTVTQLSMSHSKTFESLTSHEAGLASHLLMGQVISHLRQYICVSLIRSINK